MVVVTVIVVVVATTFASAGAAAAAVLFSALLAFLDVLAVNTLVFTLFAVLSELAVLAVLFGALLAVFSHFMVNAFFVDALAWIFFDTLADGAVLLEMIRNVAALRVATVMLALLVHFMLSMIVMVMLVGVGTACRDQCAHN